MTEPETHIDWFNVLTDIKRHGISMYALSDHIDISRTTLIYYKSGGEPKHKRRRKDY